MPINNNADIPSGTTQTIDGVEQKLFSLQERKDIADFYKRCLEDTSDTVTISQSITDESVSPAVTHSHSWTGTGGASAYWADWRSNNSSLDGSNGNGAENGMHEMWQDFVNENYQQDGVSMTKAEMITKFTNEIAQVDALIAAESESSEPSE